jgi:AcrR family transcriptional regulator
MSFARPISAAKRLSDDDRRVHILAAAERAFVRYGFHVATMSQVADEAGMSAGNLYRYFPSKEAIVEGLCAADQVERSEVFAKLAGQGDLRTAMRESLRDHVLSMSPEKARLIVEIWAESGRNPRVAEFTRKLDEDVLEGLVELVGVAKANGIAAPQIDARFVARVMFTLVAGLFKRIALEPGFDVEAESAAILGVFAGLFDGALAPAREI